MNKKLFAFLMAAVLLVSVLAGCTPKTEEGADAPKVETTYISIATGGTSGTYYPLGGALAKIFNDNVAGVVANAQSTGASVENIGLVGKGEAEVAFIQNDITYYAYTGTEVFEGKEKITNVKGMAMLYPEVIQIVALKSANINSVEDLKGKRVAIGAPGSGVEANARQVLAAHGLAYEDLAKADFLSFSEAADQLKNNQIDAAFVTAGLPTSAVTEVAQTTDITIIPISSAKVAELANQYNFYTEVTIPAGTYKGQDAAVTTTAVMAMLVVKEDLSEDFVYELTKAMFENRQVIVDTHSRGKDITLETALKGMPIEVHPGAQKYYTEKGIK